MNIFTGAQGLDEEMLELMTVTGPDGDPNETISARDGELRVRRTMSYTLPDGTSVKRSFVLTNREKIFALNTLYEKWVRERIRLLTDLK